MGTFYFAGIDGDWADNDSTATPVYVQPGMTAEAPAERVAPVEAEWAG